MNTLDADSWFDILAYVVVAVVPVTVVGILNRRHISEVKADTKQVRDQVKNSHTTNLRDDIDEVKVLLVELDRRTARIGDEIRTDREVTRKLQHDLYAETARTSRIIAKYHPEES